MEKTIEVSFDSTLGDSGGPYWYGDPDTTGPFMALGLHTHSKKDDASNPFGWYVPINKTLNALADKGVDVHLCLDSGCSS